MSGDESADRPVASESPEAATTGTEEVIDPTGDATDGETPETDESGRSAPTNGAKRESDADGSGADGDAPVESDTEPVSETQPEAETGADAESTRTGAESGGVRERQASGAAPAGEQADESAERGGAPGAGEGASRADATGGATDDEQAVEGAPAHGYDPDEIVPIGVKLGSTRTAIALPTESGDRIRTISTLTCITHFDDVLSGDRRLLFGEDAATQYPDRVEYMLRSGLPEDEEGAELAATFFEAVVDAHDLPENSAVVYAIPTIENPSGLANLEAVIAESGIGSAMVESYPESLCASIPVFGDDLEAVSEIFIAVNMGSTNLEACAYRRGEQLAPFTTGAVTGNEVDRVIASNVEEETQGRVNVDTQTAREYKEAHADFEDYEPVTDIIQQPGGGSHEFTVEWAIMDACDEYLDDAVEEFANTFLPELANDHMKVYQRTLDQPIVLTGGMACIPGIVEEFERRLSEELQREVTALAPERPDLAATLGAQRITSRMVENL